MSESGLQWISWEQLGEDYRPVKWPPPPSVLAYWCSGYTRASDDIRATVVALVRAKSPEVAKRTVERAWNPGVGEWRFAREYTDSGPPGDRFPRPDWSHELGRWPWSRRGK